MLLMAASVRLLSQAPVEAGPSSWPRTSPGYKLAEFVSEVGADRAGVHREVPRAALESGAWEKLSDGDRLWQLSIQSPGAKALRVRVASFRPDAGRLYVSGSDGIGAITMRGDSWSGVVRGDTLSLHYRPQDQTDTDLPFAIDAVSHIANAGGWSEYGAYLQVERDGGAYRCAGWPMRSHGAVYYLTSHTCIPDPAVAETAVLWHGREAHTVTPVLVATRASGGLDFSFLRLRDAPAGLGGELPVRAEIAAALPYISNFLETGKEGERAAESVRSVCGVQPIGFGTTVTGTLASSDCLSPEGNYYADWYTFSGSANQRVTITMNSGEVDSYLTLYHPSGAVAARNDDGGGNLNARIDTVLSSNGVYRLEASTFNEYTAGAYVLRLETSGIATTGVLPQRFVAVTPCRVMDTRAGEGKTGAFGPPFLSGGTSRDIAMAESGCSIPAAATAYSLNVTVAPRRPLSYLTIYPTGQTRPLASTLNSFQGKVVSNAALIPAGANGRISIFVTDDTDVIVDVNGFFTP